jgi:WD40 repeat protein
MVVRLIKEQSSTIQIHARASHWCRELRTMEQEYHTVIPHLTLVDGTKLASAGDDGFIYIWMITTGEDLANNPDSEFSLETYRVVTTLRAGCEVYDVAWSADETRIVAAGIDNSTRVFEVEGKAVNILQDHSHYVQVSQPFSPTCVRVWHGIQRENSSRLKAVIKP